MKNNKGFTLVELVVCVAIVATLCIVTGTSLNNILKNTNTNEYKENIKEILEAGSVYVELDNNKDNCTNGCTLDILVIKGVLSKDIYDKKIANNIKATADDIVYVTYDDGLKKVEYNSKSCGNNRITYDELKKEVDCYGK